MLDFINRVRKFDVQKLEWWQIALGIAGAIVALYVVFQIIRFLFTLVPIALAVLGIYFVYRWLSSRSEELPEEATKSKNEREVDQAVATVQANQTGEIQPEAAATQDDDENLAVKQVVNPETGFKEPDISRLIEREEEKMREADKVTEDIMAQIEARRRRLRGEDDS